MARGGYRPGAGRPKGAKSKAAGSVPQSPAVQPDKPVVPDDRTPLEYMLHVMNDPAASPERRDRMAIAAAGYLHGRGIAGALPKGKREMAREAAHTAASGRYAPPAPPRLVVNNS